MNELKETIGYEKREAYAYCPTCQHCNDILDDWKEINCADTPFTTTCQKCFNRFWVMDVR